MKTKKKTGLTKKATVTMSRAEASALLSAVSVALDANGGEAPKSVERALYEIVERLNTAFDFGIGEEAGRLKPGAAVTWAGSRWKVVEWQPTNGVGGSYWLRNAKGDDAVAGPDEVKVARPAKRKAAKR
jgi:hypothetical protein